MKVRDAQKRDPHRPGESPAERDGGHPLYVIHLLTSEIAETRNLKIAI